MKGMAFLNGDGELSYRDEEFLNYVDPAFLNNNRYHIQYVWKFDTDDLESMRMMLLRMSVLKLPNPVVNDFLKSINFDLSAAKAAYQK